MSDCNSLYFELIKIASGEPGLLFRAGNEVDKGHDYDPAWDYEIDETPPQELAAIAQKVCQSYYAELQRKGIIDDWMFGFEVWAANLGEHDAVAMYINGTYSWPVVLIDLRAHQGYADQIGKSIYHELIHAVQESKDEEFDEDTAEDDSTIL